MNDGTVCGPIYLPDPLQDVGRERGHSRRTSSKLHQHRQQLEERIRCLSGTHTRLVSVCNYCVNNATMVVRFVFTSGVSLAIEVKSIDTIYTTEEHKP